MGSFWRHPSLSGSECGLSNKGLESGSVRLAFIMFVKVMRLRAKPMTSNKERDRFAASLFSSKLATLRCAGGPRDTDLE